MSFIVFGGHIYIARITRFYRIGHKRFFNCAPPPEKFLTSPEVVYICHKYCVKIHSAYYTLLSYWTKKVF